METEYVEGRSGSVGITNENVMQNNSFLQLRLDTRPLLRDIELFLSAKRTFLVTDPKTNTVREVDEIVGEPLANDKGITAILNMIHLRANHHVVQGNLEEDQYRQLVSDTRKEIASTIVINCYEWGIFDSKLNMIVDTILGFYKPFLSRLIGNKERESYINQFRTSETIMQQAQKQGGLQSFAKSLGR